MTATQSSWLNLPPPEQKQPLGFEATFTDEEMDRLRLGLIPNDMGDKWFVYFSGGWLFFHRSWTGIMIYAIKLDESQDGFAVTESWVNRDPQQYRGGQIADHDTVEDRDMLRLVIDYYLLKKA